MKEDKIKRKYRLTDVEVDSVGLVSNGANREEFFLLKSEGNMPELDNETLTTEVGAEEEISQEVDNKQIESAVVTFFKRALGIDKVEETHEEDTETDELNNESVVIKAQIDSLQKRLTDTESKLQAELEKAEKTEVAKIVKGIANLPVENDEFADNLYELRKVDKKATDYFIEVIKAMDEQLKEAGIFKEMGTTSSSIEGDIVSKADAMVEAGEAESFKEALLKMDAKETNEYVEKRRADTKGK